MPMFGTYTHSPPGIYVRESLRTEANSDKSRGNWRRESTSAPSLLTKSCHDIDLLLWLLCSPTSASSNDSAHLPSRVSSSGRLHFYKHERKPPAAGAATNCLSCPIEPTCLHSAKSLYLHRQLEKGCTDRPVNNVVPDIEDLLQTSGEARASERLLDALGEDYDDDTPIEQVQKRNWFGRCVWECDNDVCDDQIVIMEWDDDTLPSSPASFSSDSNGVNSAIVSQRPRCKDRAIPHGRPD
jgi:hypothetical protein